MSIVRQDSFVRGNVASGWGTASDGNTWAIQSGNGQSVVSDEGVITNSSASTFATLGAALSGADAEGLVRFSVGDTLHNTAGILLRWTDASNHWLARFNGAASGGPAVNVMVKVAGTYTTLSPTYALSVTSGAYYWLRFRCQGTTISFRVWQDGTTEPSAWTEQYTGQSSQNVAGAVGLYGYASGSATCSFDTFSVDDLASAPTLHTLGALARGRFISRPALAAQAQAAFLVDAVGGGATTTIPTVPAYTGGVVTFAQALTAADAEWRAGVDLLASDETTPLEAGGLYDLSAPDRLLPGSASVTLDVTQTVMRTLALALRTSDGRYLPGASRYPSGGAGSPTATGLTWFNVRYRPWLDLRVGFDAAANPVWQRTYLGIFVLTQPQVQVSVTGAIAQLTLADKSALLQKPYRLLASNLPTYTASGGHTAAGYAAGTLVDTAMLDLAQRGGIPSARVHFEPTTTTLPNDYAVAEGDEPWTHLRTLAGTLGHILYFDDTGNLVRRANPLALNTPPVWTFAPGPLCTVAAATRSTDFANTFNHIIVLGGSSATALVRGEASVTNGASPYHANEIGDRVAFWGQNGLGDMTPDPTIGSVAAAQAQAQLLLAQHLGQQESVQLQGRPLPTLAPYDRITVNVPEAGLATDAQLTQLTIPLDAASSSGMSLTAAKWLMVGS